MISYAGPKLIKLDDNECIVKLKLKRRTKNHLGSMYFGALAIGADVVGGVHAFYFAQKLKKKVSLAFKSLHVDFLKRPEKDVYFVFKEGQHVQKMLQDSLVQKQRINKVLDITAYIDYNQTPEEVATFKLELSVKVL